ncbi:MAG: SprT-like domain-containing protein [Chlamydiales bacterium]|nr:SprT-like domain-containing protein [Chlamydiales bacterium]
MENFLYSESICAFIHQALSHAKKILQEEMGIHVLQKRFEINRTRYPLHIVIFEGPKMLGYFKPDLLEIGLNKLFLYTDEHLLNTLRHELAHYLCWIESGDLTHGKLFRSLCKRFGWGKEVYDACMTPEDDVIDKAQSLASKVQKLLNLSASHHEHEAKAALQKAQALLARYKPQSADEPFMVRRLLEQKRAMPKWGALMAIAKQFGVYPIINRGQGIAYLEVYGLKAHVLTAEYIIHFLNAEFERLCKVHRPKNKNTFFDGIAKGYLNALKNTEEPGLIALTTDMQKHLWMPYPHLSSHTSTRKYCDASYKAGQKVGKNLKIRSPLASSKSGALIGWKT